MTFFRFFSGWSGLILCFSPLYLILLAISSSCFLLSAFGTWTGLSPQQQAHVPHRAVAARARLRRSAEPAADAPPLVALVAAAPAFRTPLRTAALCAGSCTRGAGGGKQGELVPHTRHERRRVLAWAHARVDG